jgi:hypothetical protein
MMQRMPSNQRGFTTVYVALSLVGFFGVTAIAVDVARLAYTATEIQNGADIAATAGAHALMNGAGNAYSSQATTVLQQNKINGASANTGGTTTIEAGTYANGTFTTTTVANASAVRASLMRPVTNIVAGVFGGSNGTTNVTKTAIAGFSTISSAQPGQLPLAIGQCDFDNFNCSAGNCPSLTRVPATTNNSGWTSFSPSGTVNGPAVRPYLPNGCQGGTGAAPPTLTVGDTVQLNGGSITNFVRDVQTCFACANPPVLEFLVPIVACNGNFNGSSQVTGFATIVIDSFTYSNGQVALCGGNGTAQSINLHAIRNADVPNQTGGCANCGTGFVTLMN